MQVHGWDMVWWWTRWTRSACKETFSWMDERMKHAKVQAKEWRAHATSRKHQDNWRIRTPCHAEVKLWYAKRTSITHEHCISTCTPPPAWTYQLCRVKSCHLSSRPHHYCGAYCCNQCNVMWKSKRPSCKSEESCKVEESCKLNSHEGSWTMKRASFTLAFKYPSFVHANGFSPWLLPHSLKSL